MGGIKVASTIYPLYSIVKEVGGEKIQAKLIVPPGASPHLFEFTPGEINSLRNTKIIFCIGHGIDEWIEKVKQSLGKSKIITVDKGISLIPSGKSFGGNITYNPHYWLGIPEAITISKNVRDVLIKEDPKNSSYYNRRFEEFSKRLKIAEKKYVSILKTCRRREIVTFHDAWGYFARFLNLRVVGVFEPSGTGEPSPRHLRILSEKIKKYKIKVIFIEPQLSSKPLSAFAKDLKLKIGVLDPLGGIEGRKTYLELMNYNVMSVKEALEK